MTALAIIVDLKLEPLISTPVRAARVVSVFSKGVHMFGCPGTRVRILEIKAGLENHELRYVVFSPLCARFSS